jgi:putative endonuclease
VAPRRTVYLIQSDSRADRHYVGLTSNVSNRLAAHNSGESPHTSKFRPWRIVVSIEFDSESKAIAFEKYLKSGSGAAFLRRHLL